MSDATKGTTELPGEEAAELGTGAELDVVVVGAGFAGMYLLHRLRGQGLTVQVIEAAADVGGTWWWNRYPGARCDIESMDYSYSFSPELEQEWDWTERYATQPEILAYANHVADRFDLRRDIRFETRVTAATWDAASARWTVETDAGDRVDARFLVMAVGCLSAAKLPEIDGIDSFSGPTYHTGRWPHEGVDVAGKRVGVIGTGSSGIQSIPVLAEQAAHLTVFQRTPNFAVPAKNAPLDPEFVRERKEHYRDHRVAQRTMTRGGVLAPEPTESAKDVDDATRQDRFQAGWESGQLFGLLGSFNDLMLDRESNAMAVEFTRRQIASIVHDPELAEKLTPSTYPFGAKRVCLDTGYYATYNRIERRPGRSPGDPDRGHHPGRRAHHRARVPARCAGLRHRVRCHDRGVVGRPTSAASAVSSSVTPGRRVPAPIWGWPAPGSPTCS